MTGRASRFECTWFISSSPEGHAHRSGSDRPSEAYLRRAVRTLGQRGSRVHADRGASGHLAISASVRLLVSGLYETYWQTACTFQAALPVVPERDKFYPRQPQLVPRRFVNMGASHRDVAGLCCRPTARLGRLSRERKRLLDSFPFFTQAVFGRVYSRHKGTACQLRVPRSWFLFYLSAASAGTKPGSSFTVLSSAWPPPMNPYPGVDSRRLLRRLRTFLSRPI